MSSKSKRPSSIGGSTDELFVLNAIETHQLKAIRKPRRPTLSLIANTELAGREADLWRRKATLAKWLNDSLRPAA